MPPNFFIQSASMFVSAFLLNGFLNSLCYAAGSGWVEQKESLGTTPTHETQTSVPEINSPPESPELQHLQSTKAHIDLFLRSAFPFDKFHRRRTRTPQAPRVPLWMWGSDPRGSYRATFTSYCQQPTRKRCPEYLIRIWSLTPLCILPHLDLPPTSFLLLPRGRCSISYPANKQKKRYNPPNPIQPTNTFHPEK
ncbi:hypothetical protein K440DRAFT_67947 [Wilcoxina mikolae CBS 423.85]|nr:hypothetical protein K440DRAFT_67947 [Wilcoxina mikolae CBS 423.85]